MLKRKTEAEWACCLHGPQKELMGALLLGVLKSVVVVAAVGRKNTLWSVGGRRAKLRKELRSEARRARELVALKKVCLCLCLCLCIYMSTYICPCLCGNRRPGGGGGRGGRADLLGAAPAGAGRE